MSSDKDSLSVAVSALEQHVLKVDAQLRHLEQANGVGVVSRRTDADVNRQRAAVSRGKTLADTSHAVDASHAAIDRAHAAATNQVRRMHEDRLAKLRHD